MNKICGYSCEHNKGGVCQITNCDKKIIITTTTEPQVLTRWQDPTIEDLKKEINKLTAESTEWEERTYCWQDRAENLQIVLDKIKEYLEELLSDTKGIINDLEYHKEAHKKELELLYDDKDIFNNILELLEEIK